jgi:small conductance mechanosensitive channel
LAVRLIGNAITRQKLDTPGEGYLVSFISIAFNIELAVAILGSIGIATTSLAARITGAGIAIDPAWSGLLGNFSNGYLLQVPLPCKVSEHVMVSFNEGKIAEISLCPTTLDTPQKDSHHSCARQSDGRRHLEPHCQALPQGYAGSAIDWQS